MAVPALGRKFWTITSCTWPWRRWLAAIASRASSRSARDSPMPTRIPVVKGMPSSPAASRVASRRSGVLSGAPRWQSRPALSVSIIIPWEADTVRSRASSPAGQGAGVGVGQEPGLRQHQPGHGHQVVDRRPVAGGVEPVPGHRVAVLGSLAEGEEGLVAAGGGARPGDGQHLVGREEGRLHPGRRLGEGAVPAPVPAQPGEGDEDLGREGDPGAGGGVPLRAPAAATRSPTAAARSSAAVTGPSLRPELVPAAVAGIARVAPGARPLWRVQGLPRAT